MANFGFGFSRPFLDFDFRFRFCGSDGNFDFDFLAHDDLPGGGGHGESGFGSTITLPYP